MTISPEETTPAGLGRRQLAIAAALVALLLVAVWFLLLRGSGEPEEPATPAPVAEEPVEPEPLTKPKEAKGGGGAVQTFEVFASRDPFEPLVSSNAAASPGDGGGDADDSSTATFVGSGGGSGSVGGSTGGSDDAGGSGSVGGHRVSVLDVYQGRQGTTAQVEVDATVYRVQAGERFADSFQLVEASGRCATILFGDDQFTLCEGEQILK